MTEDLQPRLFLQENRHRLPWATGQPLLGMNLRRSILQTRCAFHTCQHASLKCFRSCMHESRKCLWARGFQRRCQTTAQSFQSKCLESRFCVLLRATPARNAINRHFFRKKQQSMKQPNKRKPFPPYQNPPSNRCRTAMRFIATE